MINHYADLLRQFQISANENIAGFFHENAASLDDLIQCYEAYNRHITNTQSNRITALKQDIISMTADEDWDDMEELELVFTQFSPAVTITGGFTSAAGDALHTFNIQLSMPDSHSWHHYESHIIQHYPACTPVVQGDKTVILIANIPGNDTPAILTALETTYTFLSQLTVQTFLHSLTSH